MLIEAQIVLLLCVMLAHACSLQSIFAAHHPCSQACEGDVHRSVLKVSAWVGTVMGCVHTCTDWVPCKYRSRAAPSKRPWAGAFVAFVARSHVACSESTATHPGSCTQLLCAPACLCCAHPNTVRSTCRELARSAHGCCSSSMLLPCEWSACRLIGLLLARQRCYCRALTL